jgi:type II secretory pathway predicted ATPase ExeA
MYTEYFGFREKPFNVTPDPRFFYTNAVYQEAYASLLYGIRERKGFIVLTGEVGTGKTTLLRRLMTNLEKSIHFAFFYNTTLSFEELLTFVCEDFGLQAEGKSPLQKIQLLNTFLLSCLQQGGTGVLLIDEAQNLRDDVLENLRLLSNLETSSEKLLQIVLVGQPELENKLAQPRLRQFRQRVAIQARLDVLKDREVEPFIYHRLRLVGYESRDLFPQETIDCICKYARGTPRLINIICDNALLVAYSADQKTISVDMIEEVARDLRLKIESAGVRVETASTSETISTSRVESTIDRPSEDGSSSIVSPDVPARPASVEPSRSKRVGIAVVLAIGAVGAALATKPLPFLSSFKILSDAEKNSQGSASTAQQVPTAGEAAEERVAARDDAAMAAIAQPKPEAAAKEDPEKLPTPAITPGAQENWRGSPVKIEHGATAFEMILRNYGSYNTLGIDLTKEANPQIEDLDRLLAGDKICVPPLNRETLLREQPDGLYHLIVASVGRPSEAERLAQTIRQKGYSVEVVPRHVSRTVSLYRIEIRDLGDSAAVDRAWKLVDTSHVLP